MYCNKKLAKQVVHNLTVPYCIKCPGMHMSLKKSSETAKEAGLLGKANIVATITYVVDVSFNSQNRNGAFKFCRNQVIHHACDEIKFSIKNISLEVLC